MQDITFHTMEVVIINNGMSVREFIDSPDTMDFVVRRTEYLDQYINENPDVLVTQTLAGRYVIAYANNNVFKSIIGSTEKGKTENSYVYYAER